MPPVHRAKTFPGPELAEGSVALLKLVVGLWTRLFTVLCLRKEIRLV